MNKEKTHCDQIVDLYRKTVSTIPKDISLEYEKRLRNLDKNSLAYYSLKNIVENITIAEKKEIPVCQDTGIPTFYISLNRKESMNHMTVLIRKATQIATKKNILRPNSVNPVNNINPRTNTGIEFPIIYFKENDQKHTSISLLLKGGGSENVGRTYSLPDAGLNAYRDIEGIKMCVIDAVIKAQGKGCPPYIISIGIGGSKDIVTRISKQGFLRKIDDKNSDEVLEKTEKELLEKINDLNIGPMGLGGKFTALAVKINSSDRHPATFFVDVNFSCWAVRRGTIVLR